MTPFFVHGWGFDAALWEPMRAELGGAACDRGYFGGRSDPPPAGPVIAIGHSLGALILLQDRPIGTRAIVTINGFDRFATAAGWPGTPDRVLARMRTRLAEAPAEVLGAFRSRCGAPAPSPATVAPDKLASDLGLLHEGDGRALVATLDTPVLVLQSGDDPILPAPLQPLLFGGAPRLTRVTRADGGHLLPLTQPAWCADQIRRFVKGLP